MVRVMKMILLLLALLLMNGCFRGQGSDSPSPVYQQIDLAEAPAELQALAMESPGVGALYVRGFAGWTYLLLQVERNPEASERLEMVDVRFPASRQGAIRVLVRRHRVERESRVSVMVLKMATPPERTYLARVMGPNDEVTELRGMLLEDR